MSNRISYTAIILLVVGLVVGAAGGVIYSTNSLQYQLEAYELQVSALTSEVDGYTSTISIIMQENIDYETEITSLENDVLTANATAYYYENLYVDLLADYQSLQTQTDITESGFEYEVFFLINQEYYHDLIEEIRNAEELIFITMYSMIYDPGDSLDWANDLIKELVYAKDRGIYVVVFLEYQTFFGFQDENLDAYDFLTANGVDVRLDYENDTDHLKTVNIDQSIFYIGSHNWSESGLYDNNEMSVKLVKNP